MLSISIALLAVLPVMNAQSTVSLFFPGLGDNQYVGSIAGSDETATTYVITCASETSSTVASATRTSSPGDNDDFEECGLGPEPITMTQGPSTLHAVNSFAGYPQTLDCALDGTTAAVCTVSQPEATAIMASMTDFTGSFFESIPTAITTTLGGSVAGFFVPVTITAGAIKDGASASATDAGATASPAAGNTKSAAATKTGSVSTKATEASTSASTANPASASGTTGAAPINVASAFGGGLMALAVGMVAAIL